jgi:acetyl esterase/lipase
MCAAMLGLPLGCTAPVSPKPPAVAPAKRTVRYFAERDKRPVETIIYKTVGDTELQLLVCKPDGWRPGQKRPAMVWIHGGGWVAGSPEQFVPHMKYSASRGAVAFGVQYRIMKSSGYRDDKKKSEEENRRAREARHRAFMEGPSLPDCIADCEDAMRYVRGHAPELGVDPDRISAIGDSSGAHLAACMGTIAAADARANAVIACSSISDLTYGFGGAAVKPGKDGAGRTLEEDPDRMARAKAMSPHHNIATNGTSFLILHGQNDWLKDEPQRFFRALKGAGVDCEYKVYPTAKHAFIVYGYSATLEEISRALIDMDAFLLERGLLDGPTSIRLPGHPTVAATVAAIPGPFAGKRVVTRDDDFPGFLTISLQLRLPDRFRGTLVQMTGRYGFTYKVSNGDHDFSALRMRLRGKQDLFKPGVWQDVEISLRRDKVVISVDGRTVEAPNPVGHTFVSNELVFADGLDAEIRDVKVRTYVGKETGKL